MKRLIYLLILITTLLPLSASTNLTERSLQINGQTFIVELADNPSTRAQGLMYRTQLDPLRGMLFVFPDSERRSFYMKNTFIPLSIAYISADGIIMEIYDMQPHELRSVPSRYAVMYALEVNQGLFKQLNITAGMKVHNLPPASPN
ncbi:DUF192 domain-containing protein [Entomospira culicis]|uniref:DUF192 domain-containing protein n=1 Tax=Entomospira culicis TaxID=2719989 RepID=A0A968GGR3_9SPIO|nr:DUF192 domain-containing protein [Entomospira culicis]NIZ18531.1 DUF192 domain-containing protein [Entomospira culicis]NIZ68747.1 DUF192 domain-containing protein [Entomospira culicis]WDI37343.1 DUF192 domain-containing protein [Entomospira culicis]WDI38972.1 DUF192 domain-containing protein [Entomospira culicis]